METKSKAPIEAEIMEEFVDIEVYAQSGKKPPMAREYRFKVNDILCVWKFPTIHGREILTVAGLTPPENYSLREKIKGSTPRRIELDEVVDLRKPGVEKFRAIRKDQTEG
jgi:hypothetical protein